MHLHAIHANHSHNYPRGDHCFMNSNAYVMLSVWVCLYVWVSLIIPSRAPVVVQCYVLASSNCQGQRAVPLKSAQTSRHTIVLISCTTELQKNSAWRKEGAKPCGGVLRRISFSGMFQSNRNYSTSSWETQSSAQGQVKGGSLYHVYLTQPWQWKNEITDINSHFWQWLLIGDTWIHNINPPSTLPLKHLPTGAFLLKSSEYKVMGWWTQNTHDRWNVSSDLWVRTAEGFHR